MNVYNVGICPRCEKPIIMNDTILVHGFKNLEIAFQMLEEKRSLREVSEEFCGYCGNHMPCNCELRKELERKRASKFAQI